MLVMSTKGNIHVPRLVFIWKDRSFDILSILVKCNPQSSSYI